MADELTVEQAFEVLGISQISNADEIRSAFRELSKQRHPDAPDGSHDQQAKLNRAYEAALAYSKGGQLVVVEVKKALQIVERNIAAKKPHKKYQPAFVVAGIAGFMVF